jgi:hypothetical protein
MDRSMLGGNAAPLTKPESSSASVGVDDAGEVKRGKEHLRRWLPKGYFDDCWNIFDFFIVVATWVLLPVQYALGDNDDLGRLVRIFRIARPMRVIRTLDGAKDVLKTFPRAVSDIGDVLALLLFVFVVYAILGINLFGIEGQYHGRCVVKDGYELGTHGLLLKGNFDDVEPLCHTDSTCPTGFKCSCKARVLPDATLEKPPYAFADPVWGDPGCISHEEARTNSLSGDSETDSGELSAKPRCPNNGYECFDNFALALYTIFTKITLDGWSTSMWWAQDTNGDAVGMLFYLSLVGMVSFNIINLNIAVISSAYTSVREERREINQAKAEHFKSLSKDKNAAEDEHKPPLVARLRTALQICYERSVARRTSPMPALALAVRRFCTAPLTVDECGNRVPVDIIYMAAVRNLTIKFGPEFGQWTLISGPAAAVPAPKDDCPSCQEARNGLDETCCPRSTLPTLPSVEGAEAHMWLGPSLSDTANLYADNIDYASYVVAPGLGGGGGVHVLLEEQERQQREGITIGTSVAQGFSTNEDLIALRAQVFLLLL